MTDLLSEATVNVGDEITYGFVNETHQFEEFSDEHPYWDFITQAERDKAEAKGQAMPGGGYPVRNASDLDKAIKAVGRGKANHNAIRKHIIAQAKKLGLSEKIPDNWNPDGSLKKAAASTEAEETLDEGLAADGSMLTPDQIAGLPERWHAYVFVEGLQTTDGRAANVDAGQWRDLPLPISWQRKNEPGHMGAEVVGSIESIERMAKDGYSVLYAEGSFDLGGEHGQEAARQVQLQGGTRWVSADIEPLAEEWCSSETGEPVDGSPIDVFFGGDSGYSVLTSYRVLGATIVAKPAFPQCVIAPIGTQLPDVEPLGQEAEPEPTPVPMLVASITNIREAAAPSSWFAQPALHAPTALEVTDEGRVYGHIAEWKRAHTGYNGVKRYPPRNHDGQYKFFLTGKYACCDDVDVRIGQLTMGCGHPDLANGLWSAKAHYDGGPGATQAADVAIGEDEIGIWAAGAMRPGLNVSQVREFLALSPSGDWRPLDGHLELVACVQVPVPGFPVPRAIAASGCVEFDGRPRERYERVGDEMELVAMVAAGRVVHDPIGDAVSHIMRRLSVLEATIEMAGLAEVAAERLTASLA